MNKSFKHLSFSIVLLSILTTVNTQCMLINKLSKFNFFALKQNDKKMIARMICSTNKSENICKALMCLPDENKEPSKVIWGPLKNFISSRKSKYPSVTPEPWSSGEKVNTFSAAEIRSAIKEWEKLHKAYNDNNIDS